MHQDKPSSPGMGDKERLPVSGDVEAALSSGALDQVMLQAFMDSMQDCIYFKDRHSRFLRVNAYMARRLTGGVPADFIGKSDFDFFTREHAQPAFDAEEAIMREGEAIIGLEEKETFPDGHVAWVVSSKMPLRDLQGNVIGTFGISRDITLRKETELKLAATEKELIEASRLAGMMEVSSGVLHNIGNGLNSVITSVSTLIDQQSHSRLPNLGKAVKMMEERLGDLPVFLSQDPKGRQVPGYLVQVTQILLTERDQAQRELEILRRNLEHIKELISMQQSFARGSLEDEEFAPVDLFEESIRISEASLNRHGVSVVKAFEPVPRVRVSRHKVIQVLVNFIRNAKNALDESGRQDKEVVLRLTRSEDGFVRFEVRDNGVGISAENMPKLFGFGFTTRKHGHGFGLHSTMSAARDMGGRVKAESPGPDQGATFSLDVPPVKQAGIPS